MRIKCRCWIQRARKPSKRSVWFGFPDRCGVSTRTALGSTLSINSTIRISNSPASNKTRSIPVWEGKLPPGWHQFSKSNRSLSVEHLDYPGYIFKFCSGVPGRGNPAAHFLRVPKGKELHRIVNEEKLDRIDIVVEQLITVKTSAEIKQLRDSEQCYSFIVKSIKLPLQGKADTIREMLSRPVDVQTQFAVQIMKLICKSGLGDVGFHNILYNPASGKLTVVDTEPLYGSLLLDERSVTKYQYDRTRKIIEFTTNLKTAIQGLDEMIDLAKDVPVFKQVAQIYKQCMQQVYGKK